MLPLWMIVAASAGYLALLFAIAYWGDRRADAGRSVINNGWVYALSLAVYATSWTYYGSVGRAAVTGPGFLTTYLGPTLVFAVGWLVLRKIIRISRQQRITSLADFVSARYGQSRLLAGLVTLVAVAGIVPYIALQLKAVSHTFTILRNAPALTSPGELDQPVLLADTALYVALLLAAFTILFGTRHLDASERHEGMVAAVAFESVVKLLAFLAVGVFVTFVLFDGPAALTARAAADPRAAALFTLSPQTRYGDWLWLTVLSALAVLLLPRQWQVAVVENTDERHVARASWLFPTYLLLISLFVLPIAAAGLLRFPAGTVDPDTVVLALPIAAGQNLLALVVFLGGLSASTAMIIVESVALSTMVSNSLVVPGLLSRRVRFGSGRDLSGFVLAVRRVTIVAVLLLGYAYFRVAGEDSLVSIGLMSFAVVAQFAPALLGGLYWRGGTRVGALTGIVAGFAVWSYTLLVPSLARSGWLPRGLVDDGPWGISLLRPTQLFGLTGMDEVGQAMFWSMLVNVGGYVGVSLLGRHSTAEYAQAAVFVDALRRTGDGAGARLRRGSAPVADLRALLERFLGEAGAREVLDGYARNRGLDRPPDGTADSDLVHHVETVLAGAVGTASARILVGSVVEEEPLGLDEVMRILDEASQVRTYSRQLERKSRELEAATAELRAANERLRELDRLKDDFVSTVSHELRTPLTSIRAFSEILLDNPELPADQRQRYLEIVVAETERLTRLVNEVLDQAAQEQARRLADVDLGELVRHAATQAAQLFADRGARLDVTAPPDGVRVLADRDRVVQVMLNLLANAAKFCKPAGGRVSVAVHSALAGGGGKADDGMARIDVRDDGPGIPTEQQEVIFERFQRGDSAADRPGSGLGLAISREIVQRMGGRLWVESRPGSGATFSFTLPLSGTPAAPRAES